jgi:hypothetical protein
MNMIKSPQDNQSKEFTFGTVTLKNIQEWRDAIYKVVKSVNQSLKTSYNTFTGGMIETSNYSSKNGSPTRQKQFLKTIKDKQQKVK